MKNNPIQIKIEGTIKFCNGIATPLEFGKPLRPIRMKHCKSPNRIKHIPMIHFTIKNAYLNLSTIPQNNAPQNVHHCQ